MAGAPTRTGNFVLAFLFVAALVSVAATDEAAVHADDAAPPHHVHHVAPQHVRHAVPHRSHHAARTTVTVTGWYGRLGNNLHQIRQATKVAVCCQSVLQLPDSHYVLNMTQTTFDLGHGVPTGRKCPHDISDQFFFIDQMGEGAHRVFHECAADVDDVWSAIADSLFPRPSHMCATYSTPDCCPPDMDDVLVAHVRSGDLFSSKEPSKDYFPAPLVYYTRVMAERNWSRVVLVTEDELNPVITILGKVMKGVLSPLMEVFSRRLEDDVHMLRCAVHFAISRSSFSERLAALAPNLRTVYSPYAKGCPKKNVTGVFYTFPNFNDTHWANTPDQINDMVRQSDVVREAYDC